MPAESQRSSAERLYLAGSGSFAAEVADWATSAGWDIAGAIELIDPGRVGATVGALEVLGVQAPEQGSAVAIAAGGSRRDHWSHLSGGGWQPRTIVHPHACVSSSASLGAGCVVGPGAVIGAESQIGEHTLVSRGVLVGHHVRIGAFVSLLPGANLASHIAMDDDTIVGMGAIVVDHTAVGPRAIVAAGAVVLSEVAADERVQGVPARPYRR
ncbi:MAG: LbetaH domain-containing protein [Solirubrobacteraceae bacterium]